MKNENNNVAICDCLKAVVKDTVKHYARDYKIDEARIKQAAKEVAKTGKPQTFLWFARECGTYMGRESEVIKRNPPAYMAYKYYNEQETSESKTIKAYLVTVTGIDGKTPIGTACPLNYAKECDRCPCQQYGYRLCQGYGDAACRHLCPVGIPEARFYPAGPLSG